MTKPPLVYLEWADAVCNARWMTQSEAENWSDATEWIIYECGWIVKETKEYIVFASGWKPEDNNTHAQFVNMHKIPKTWIRKRQTLKVK